jgi:hypothetical protein
VVAGDRPDARQLRERAQQRRRDRRREAGDDRELLGDLATRERDERRWRGIVGVDLLDDDLQRRGRRRQERTARGGQNAAEERGAEEGRRGAHEPSCPAPLVADPPVPMVAHCSPPPTAPGGASSILRGVGYDIHGPGGSTCMTRPDLVMGRNA